MTTSCILHYMSVGLKCMRQLSCLALDSKFEIFSALMTTKLIVLVRAPRTSNAVQHCLVQNIELPHLSGYFI